MSAIALLKHLLYLMDDSNCYCEIVTFTFTVNTFTMKEWDACKYFSKTFQTKFTATIESTTDRLLQWMAAISVVN